jgi:hypothetical protein
MLIVFLSVSFYAVGQNNSDKKFVPYNSAPDFSVIDIAESQQISFSFIKGKIDGKEAASVVMENKNKELKTILCNVKDRKGRIVTSGEIIIAAGEKIYAFNSERLSGKLIFTLAEGKSMSDYQLEIIQK